MSPEERIIELEKRVEWLQNELVRLYMQNLREQETPFGFAARYSEKARRIEEGMTERSEASAEHRQLYQALSHEAATVVFFELGRSHYPPVPW